MDNDQLKYLNTNHFPTATGQIKATIRGNKYAVKLDTAQDISESFYQFADAYFSSAELIANRMLEKQNIAELDKYFFPLFFLYRHSIELLLKSIACILITENSKRAQFFRDTFHNPETLLQQILCNTQVRRPDDEIRWLEEYFHNLSEFDKASDSFRYPFHVKCKSDGLGSTCYSFNRVFSKQTHIDLIGEANKMQAAYEILKMWRLDFLDKDHMHVAKDFHSCSTLFLEEGGTYYEQSVVGYEYHHDDFYAYCSGYMECGNFLKQWLIEQYDQNAANIEHLLYPMCYLYRNETELLLKTIIYKEADFSRDEIGRITFENKHSIFKLFSIIETAILPLYSLDANDQEIQNVKRYCNELHSFDSDSSRFRYPVNKECVPYISTIRYYDFVALGDFLESLCNALDGIYSEIDHRREEIAEMQAEYANY